MLTKEYSMTTIYEYGVRTSVFHSIESVKDWLLEDDGWNYEAECNLYDSDGPNCSDFSECGTLGYGLSLFSSGVIDSIWAESLDKSFTFIITPVYRVA